MLTSANGVERSGGPPAGRIPAAAGRPPLRPAIVVIGASTGGPQALVAMLENFGPLLPHVPVCVTLHMPRDLMPVVASHVARRCRVATKVVNERCRLHNGLVCFAPGDSHLDFLRGTEGVEVAPMPATSRGYCKPAIDNMFAGAARVFGARTLGVVLSGMGEDGLAGARVIAQFGGTLLVQDRRSSAVWGMPGAVAKAGLAAAVLPPAAIAGEIGRRFQAGGVAL